MFKKRVFNKKFYFVLSLFLIILIIFSVLAFLYFTKKSNSDNSELNDATKLEESIIQKGSKVDISVVVAHATKNDCWIEYQEKIYDITNIIPIGKLDETVCGTSIEDNLDEETVKTLDIYYIANLEK